MGGYLKRSSIVLMFCALLLALLPHGAGPGVPVAVEVGEPAPDFNLPATTGVNISLSEFRGKKWVLLEFYGLDFAPT